MTSITKYYRYEKNNFSLFINHMQCCGGYVGDFCSKWMLNRSHSVEWFFGERYSWGTLIYKEWVVEGVQNGRYFADDESLPSVVVEFVETFNHLKQSLTGRYEMSGGRTLHYNNWHCVEFNQKGTFKKIKGVGLINEVYGEALYEIDSIALSILKSKLNRENKAR